MENLEQKSLRVKGYAESNGKIVSREGNIIIFEVNKLSEYVEIISSFETENTMFYRGQPDVNFLLTPLVFRDSIDREDILIKKFSRFFSTDVYSYRTMLERLAFMQHYGLKTRCLDITLDPLIGLFFACQSMPDKYGEVFLFSENENRNVSGDKDVKYIDSITTGIIANCAILKQKFTLGELHARVMDDNHPGQIENIISFQDILSSSIILETPFDNSRIRNQKGAFILCNANKIDSLKDCYGENMQTDYDRLTTALLSSDLEEFSIRYKNCYKIGKQYFYNIDEWGVGFEKIENPYASTHTIERMRTDPFNLNRLRFRNKTNQYVVIVIPPSSKWKILKELERFHYNKILIYPEKEQISRFLNETPAKQ
ncbi:MAG: FRG domain-containing protein [Lachnospiraceae bacterium]|nr:FRG domain-containing protein [Lachnospiraceae bacterium]